MSTITAMYCPHPLRPGISGLGHADVCQQQSTPDLPTDTAGGELHSQNLGEARATRRRSAGEDCGRRFPLSGLSVKVGRWPMPTAPVRPVCA